ncbi:MAG: hypothetical protein JWN70_4855 [Planctomycetaceae bacterium]|nr:hypothetical protein [Planctomycetaceae bacterium]
MLPADNRPSMFASIFWGDDCPNPATGRDGLGWVAAEEGMISIITLITVLFFLIVVGMLGNIGLIINQKIEVQNGADSIALSASQVEARGMNAVTASNHIIGELLALVVIHHSFGGDELDNGESKDSPEDNSTKEELDLAYEVAETLGSGETLPPMLNSETVKNDVYETPKAGATLFDSVIRLRRVLSWAFYAYGLGGALQKVKEVPIVGWILFGIGVTICTAALTYIEKVYVERKILSFLETLASATKSAKQIAVMAIKGLYLYQQAVVTLTPFGVVQAKDHIASQALVNGQTFPGMLPPAQLPVETEPENLDPLNHSQLARAMWPWTDRWRSIIQDLMWQWLRLSRSANYYDYYSVNYSWDWIHRMKNDEGVHLYVLKDLYGDGSANGDKGNEQWTQADGSARADELFSLMGFAHRSAPRLASSGIFKSQNPDGVVGYAQAMIYNANPQHGPGGGSTQARVGWDTLNWTTVVPELPDRPSEVDPGAYHNLNWSDDAQPYPDKPAMFMNWRTKLVPETRLREAAVLPGSIGTIVRRMIPVPRSFKTH